MKEFIEIPFGAKDSELCGWEYTIPKGFVASIENGKIIVKKEEDYEDERIRKKLIEAVKGDMVVGGTKDKQRAIAWLEKKGEQKSVWSKDDEDYLLDVNFAINDCFDEGYAEELRDWLKSFKERNTWKPSEEQLNALDEVYKTHGANGVCRRIIFKLLEQLKKL